MTTITVIYSQVNFKHTLLTTLFLLPKNPLKQQSQQLLISITMDTPWIPHEKIVSHCRKKTVADSLLKCQFPHE